MMTMSDEEKDREFSFDDLSKRLESQLTGSSDDTNATGEVREITDSDVIGAIRSSSTSVVTFFRDDCPYCERLMPILYELATDYKAKVAFAKVNISRIDSAREEFDIFGIPLVVAFKKGMTVGRIEGLRSIDEYDIWIESIHNGLRPMGLDEGPTTRLD